MEGKRGTGQRRKLVVKVEEVEHEIDPKEATQFEPSHAQDLPNMVMMGNLHEVPLALPPPPPPPPPAAHHSLSTPSYLAHISLPPPPCCLIPNSARPRQPPASPPPRLHASTPPSPRQAPLLYLLQRRLKNGDIYTWAGDVLISLNPYAPIASLYQALALSIHTSYPWTPYPWTPCPLPPGPCPLPLALYHFS